MDGRATASQDGETYIFPELEEISIYLMGKDGDALTRYINRYGNLKPFNCYAFSSKEKVVLDKSQGAQFDSVQWVQCPYTQHNAGNEITGQIASVEDMNDRIAIRLGDQKASYYRKNDEGLADFVKKHRKLPGAGQCVRISAAGEKPAYIPGQETYGHFEVIPCSRASVRPKATESIRLKGSFHFGTVNQIVSDSSWFVIALHNGETLGLSVSDKGLTQFRKQNGRFPRTGDCIGYKEFIPDGAEKNLETQTLTMKRAQEMDCFDGH